MNIYQHFRSDEKVFVDSCQQWKEQVEQMYAPKLTSFLTPREQQILASIVGKNEDCQVVFKGAYEQAERKRALLYPAYFTPEDSDFELALLEITYNAKFHQLRHQQILGSLMSLGLKREKFGDILLVENIVQIVVSHEISSYVQNHVNKIGSAGVSVVERNLEDIIQVQEVWQEQSVTSSSLRIDNVLSSMTNLSRNKAQEAIVGGKVKVNHQTVEKNDFDCHEGDLISVRGLGRFKLIGIEGKTKREKWRIVFGKQK
ncbi:MAG: RNA-binding protein [Bacillus sp. (in: firmicutes)]